jgi:hypothetical protein
MAHSGVKPDKAASGYEQDQEVNANATADRLSLHHARALFPESEDPFAIRMRWPAPEVVFDCDILKPAPTSGPRLAMLL